MELIALWLSAFLVIAGILLGLATLLGDFRSNSDLAGRNLTGGRPTMREAVLERSLAERFFSPVASTLGERLLRFTPVGWVISRNEVISKAGLTGRITAEVMLGAKIVAPIVAAALTLPSAIGNSGFMSIMLALLSILGTFMAPDFLVKAIADRRSEEIEILLPDMLDQLTISVEAGLGFEAALARMVRGQDNVLADEFGRMLQDVQLGHSRTDALSALAKRSQVDDLRSMVLTLRQAETLGVPLASSLRLLALEMRERRKFRAEERAHQLPVKMIFPLGLCIMPALFIMMLGPAVLGFRGIF